VDEAKIREQVVQIISDVMGVDADAIEDGSSPDTVEAWDSLKHMNLILAVEDEFGIQFGDDQIVEMVSVRAILEAIRELTG
jgi:acyl carrier protein